MNPTSLIVVFVVVWWLVFFMVLPVGIVTDKPKGDGNMNGAPKNPNLKIKAVITTIITIILTAIYFYLIENGYIVFG